MVHLVDYLAVGVIDETGNPLSNGTVTAYEAGTTTLATLYQERELTTPHANPATLDAAGKLVAFSAIRLKLLISDSSGVPVRTIDNVGIGDGDVIASDLGDDIAGAGLTGGNGQPLAINADSTSLEVADDVLRIKAEGVRGTHLHTSCADDSTLEVASDAMRIKDGGIISGKPGLSSTDDSTLEVSGGKYRIKDAGVTKPKYAALDYGVGVTSGNVSASSSAEQNCCSVVYTSSGRPVMLIVQPDGSANPGYINSTSATSVTLRLKRDGTLIACTIMVVTTQTFTGFVFLDTAATAGSHTWLLTAQNATVSTVNLQFLRLIAYEPG